MPECTLDKSALPYRDALKLVLFKNAHRVLVIEIQRALSLACNARHGTKLTVFSEQPQIPPPQ